MWVKHGGSGQAKQFPLVGRGKKLPVSAIAAFWKLDPSTLCIGEDVVLLFDKSSGNSVSGAESIARTAQSLGLGNGSSKSAAIPITGQPRAADSFSSWLQSLDKCIKVPDSKQYALKRKRDAQRFQAEFDRVFHSKGGIHAYRHRIENAMMKDKSPANMFRVLESEVLKAKIIGWLHVVKKAGETLDTSNRRGMVTLVRPEGTCVTSETCMGRLADGERYVVHLADKSYECTGKCSLGVGILEPLQSSRQNFAACAPVAPVYGVYADAYSPFCDPGSGEVRMVHGLKMGCDGSFDEVAGFGGAGWRYVMMPEEHVEIPLGAPVLCYTGGLSGVVVGFGQLENSETRSSREARDFGARFPITTGDFRESMTGLPPGMVKKLNKYLEANLVVYFMRVSGKFSTPEEEWNRAYSPSRLAETSMSVRKLRSHK